MAKSYALELPLLVVLYSVCVQGQTPQFTITTVAGNGTTGYSGDGGQATRATFDNPLGMTIDSAGNVYIADFYNNVVRKVAPNGVITTYAGNGAYGFSGDGGPATKASLAEPEVVLMDSAGNLYIADYGNRVRRVAPNGTITTIAGNGVRGYSGDGGSATSASIDFPGGLALDSSGNLFISSGDDGTGLFSAIRKVTPAGVIATVAGTGSPGYSGDGGPATRAAVNLPIGLTFDSAGNLFFADRGNNRIRKISNGIITTVAGNGIAGYAGDGGPAVNAEISLPASILFDAVGNLYIADRTNNRVRVLLPNGTITTVAGNGTAGSGVTAALRPAPL